MDIQPIQPIQPIEGRIAVINSQGNISYTLGHLPRHNNWSISIKELTAHEISKKVQEGYTLGSCYECKGEGETLSPYVAFDSNGKIRPNGSYVQCQCCEGKKKILYSIEFKKIAEAVLNRQTNLDKKSEETNDL